MTDAAAITAGREAWQRICRRSRTSFDDWVAVGKAVAIGRAESLQRAGTDRAFGRIYQGFMADWLRESGLDGVQSQERYWSLQLVDNLAAIQRWRETLDDEQRRKWNHPQAIWVNWRTSLGEHAARTAPAPNQHRAKAPSHRGKSTRAPQDTIRIVASALRQHWTPDTIVLASAVCEAMRENREVFLEFLNEPPARRLALVSEPALAIA